MPLQYGLGYTNVRLMLKVKVKQEKSERLHENKFLHIYICGIDIYRVIFFIVI